MQTWCQKSSQASKGSQAAREARRTREDVKGHAREEKPRPSGELLRSRFVRERGRRKPRKKLPHVRAAGDAQGVEKVRGKMAHVIVEVSPRTPAAVFEVRVEILRHLSAPEKMGIGLEPVVWHTGE